MNRKVFSVLFLLLIPFLSVSGCDDEGPTGTGGVFFRYPTVVMETTLGDIVVELYIFKAPETVRNFLEYVGDGFYNGSIFHRVIRSFIVQGGGYNENLELIPTRDPIENEAANGLKNKKYTLSMARTNVVNSATSQFFFNTVDNPGLDHRDDTDMGYGYCVFGEIIEGMDVLDTINVVETTIVGDFHDVPVEPVFIIRIIRKR